MAATLQLIGVMGAIGASWGLLFVIFVGCGLWVARAAGGDRFPRASPFLLFWLGWAATIGFLQIWHLSLPVDARAFALVAAAGLAGWWKHARQIPALCRELLPPEARDRRWLVPAALAVIVLWANLAVGPPYHGDTGLYHLQGVRWSSSFPIVPGLGNLHDRLAFNNSSFLYAALLDIGPWQRGSHHLANGLLSLVLMLELLRHLPGAMRTSSPRWMLDAWHALLLPAAWIWSYKLVTSYSPDLITFALGIMITTQLLELLRARGAEGSSPGERAFRFFSISVLASAAVTVKIPFAPLGALTLALAFVAACRPVRAIWSEQRRGVLCAVLGGAMLVIPWAVRGIFLSGYPAYPQTILAWDVPWRIPVENVQRTRDWWLLAFARAPHMDPEQALATWDWLAPWLWQQVRDLLRVTLPLLCFGIGCIQALRPVDPQRRRQAWRTWGWLMVPSLATVGVMLMKAPNPRFAGAAIWMLAVMAMLLSLTAIAPTSLVFQRRWHWARALTLALILVAIVKSVRFTHGPTAMREWNRMPEPTLMAVPTWSGLTVLVPTDGDQAWDAPLPNTPAYDPRVSARDPQDLSRGFWIR